MAMIVVSFEISVTELGMYLYPCMLALLCALDIIRSSEVMHVILSVHTCTRGTS
jgi:hypothetical protein